MSTIDGLPAHILLVHLVVVFVPLTALALIVCALSPAAARRAGLALPLLALVTLAAVPLTTDAGEWLERHVDRTDLVRRHTELGDGLLPWAAGLFLLSVLVWWAARRAAGGGRPFSAALRIGAGVLCAAVAVGAVVDVYLIGDSGAKAAWQDALTGSGTEGGEGH
ncbi:DUF2231 domain-containing protein [Kitasatospora cheerisanensis]|uniref:DUF2231 domain-containing protein n=1 Tax=Kitasatospora cheerisanensis KCTC 2395 TaxID=1348663 RepID=A0A066Z276_9ACTN|nr:DUF2231 domain-containing protein [Kitasatospora cheerisanensis]KDN87883.1 hypothetical protein KCH_05300 [Kitasatospora cheerisanensis KCTC 2395]